MYRIQLQDEEIYVAFLLEHKSHTDKFTALQVSRYIIDLWEQVLRNENYLPVVVPFVFYHGKQTWNDTTDISNYIPNYEKLPDYFKKRMPTIKHDLITMEDHDEKRMHHYHPITRAVLRSFKYIYYDKQTLIHFLLISIDELGQDLHKDDIKRIIEIILLYFSAENVNITEDDIIKKVNELDGKRAQIVSILQEKLEEGREEGREKAQRENALNMLRDGLTVEQVAKYSGLSIEKVAKMKKQL